MSPADRSRVSHSQNDQHKDQTSTILVDHIPKERHFNPPQVPPESEANEVKTAHGRTFQANPRWDLSRTGLRPQPTKRKRTVLFTFEPGKRPVLTFESGKRPVLTFEPDPLHETKPNVGRSERPRHEKKGALGLATPSEPPPGAALAEDAGHTAEATAAAATTSTAARADGAPAPIPTSAPATLRPVTRIAQDPIHRPDVPAYDELTVPEEENDNDIDLDNKEDKEMALNDKEDKAQAPDDDDASSSSSDDNITIVRSSSNDNNDIPDWVMTLPTKEREHALKAQKREREQGKHDETGLVARQDAHAARPLPCEKNGGPNAPSLKAQPCLAVARPLACEQERGTHATSPGVQP